jgi:DnaJ-class molecular chaperone
VKEKKALEVNVERGAKHGEKIVFRGEADEAVSITIYSLFNAGELASNLR